MKKEMFGKKGVSPVIATVLLIGLVIIIGAIIFLWFRNIGLGYAKICTRLSLIGSDYVNIYFHPWEFVNLEKLKYSDRLPKLIIRNTGEILEKNVSSSFCLFVEISKTSVCASTFVILPAKLQFRN